MQGEYPSKVATENRQRGVGENRALVLTLWAVIDAERLGYEKMNPGRLEMPWLELMYNPKDGKWGSIERKQKEIGKEKWNDKQEKTKTLSND